MRIIIDNVKSQLIVGGKDNLMRIDLFKELYDYMAVRPDGYQYVDAYRKKHWDGYKRFLHKNGSFATGFLPMLLKYCDELGVPVIEIEDIRKNIPKFKLEFEDDIKIYTLRDYQTRMVEIVNNYIEFRGQQIYFPRGIIDAATNAGKNAIMAGISLNMENSRSLMLIHNQTIFRQAVKYFSDIFPVGQIGLGKYSINTFTIAMYKTLLNRAKKSVNVRNDISQFNVLYVDEAHRSSSDEYISLLTMINSGVRILVSGTPLDTDNKMAKMMTIGISGPVLGKISNKELIEKKVSLEPKIHIFLNKGTNMNATDYDEEYEDNVKFSVERAEHTIKFYADKTDKFMLVAFNDIDHGVFLLNHFNAAKSRYNSLKNTVISMVSGEDPQREEKIQMFAEGKINILITSTIMQEGLNIPNINILSFCIGNMSKIQVKQFVGRAIRDDNKSDYVDVLDFYDVGNWVEAHSRSRIRLYKAEGFDIQFYYQSNSRGYYIPD